MTYDDVSPKEFEPTQGDVDRIDAISHHIEKHVGPIKLVFHEIVSDKVHIDVHWIEPSETLPFNVLVTSGMSDLPMSVPNGMEDYRFAELCMILPPDWPLDMESLKASEDNYWPIRHLKQNAKFPHEYDTYFSTGHTVQGEDGETFSPNGPFSGFLIAVPISLSEKFQVLHLKNGDSIHFYCLVPLYAEELNVKTIYGLDDLFELFERFDVTDVVDLQRPNMAI